MDLKVSHCMPAFKEPNIYGPKAVQLAKKSSNLHLSFIQAGKLLIPTFNLLQSPGSSMPQTFLSSQLRHITDEILKLNP